MGSSGCARAGAACRVGQIILKMDGGVGRYDMADLIDDERLALSLSTFLHILECAKISSSCH